MLNPLNLISKLMKSPNQKELDRYGKIVSKINETLFLVNNFFFISGSSPEP